jgi:hypothetical protein
MNWTEIAVSCISLLGTVAAIVAAGVSAKSEQARQRERTRNEMLLEGVQASLDGICQLGADHDVTVARDKLKEFLRKESAK